VTVADTFIQEEILFIEKVKKLTRKPA